MTKTLPLPIVISISQLSPKWKDLWKVGGLEWRCYYVSDHPLIIVVVKSNFPHFQIVG